MVLNRLICCSGGFQIVYDKSARLSLLFDECDGVFRLVGIPALRAFFTIRF